LKKIIAYRETTLTNLANLISTNSEAIQIELSYPPNSEIQYNKILIDLNLIKNEKKTSNFKLLKVNVLRALMNLERFSGKGDMQESTKYYDQLIQYLCDGNSSVLQNRIDELSKDSSILNVALLYNDLGKYYLGLKEYNNAELFLFLAEVKLRDDSSTTPIKVFTLSALSEVYKKFRYNVMAEKLASRAIKYAKTNNLTHLTVYQTAIFVRDSMTNTGR